MKCEVLVSVLIIAYNHEKYIQQTLNSVLTQKTGFPFELVIGEDCSNDKTRDIFIEYQKKYPHKIRLLSPERNIGVTKNFVATLKACTGKYIALCEGDDYWTDPYKLQKQVALLEANPDSSLCFTNTTILYEEQKTTEIAIKKAYPEKFSIIEYQREKGMVPTATLVFRNYSILKEKRTHDLFYQTIGGDYVLRWILGDLGSFLYIHESTAVYRKHEKGLSQTLQNPKALLIGIKTNQNLNVFFNSRYRAFIGGYDQYAYLRIFYYYCSKRKIGRILQYFFRTLLDPNRKLIKAGDVILIIKSGLKNFIRGSIE